MLPFRWLPTITKGQEEEEEEDEDNYGILI